MEIGHLYLAPLRGNGRIVGHAGLMPTTRGTTVVGVRYCKYAGVSLRAYVTITIVSSLFAARYAPTWRPTRDEQIVTEMRRRIANCERLEVVYVDRRSDGVVAYFALSDRVWLRRLASRDCWPKGIRFRHQYYVHVDDTDEFFVVVVRTSSESPFRKVVSRRSVWMEGLCTDRHTSGPCLADQLSKAYEASKWRGLTRRLRSAEDVRSLVSELGWAWKS